jgi:serine/threonine protein phosphatase 1
MNKRLFAIGDIHGCFDSFRTLVEQKIQIKKSDKIILLGDYIDRGTHSKEVLDYIIDLQNNGFDIVPLTGNHEVMLLDAFYNDEHLSLWIQNGGTKTLKSFGIGSLKNLDPEYITFFEGLSYYFAIEEYLFVHAGFNDRIDNPFDDQYSMIWERKESYRHPLLKDKTIVHGHNPVPVTICKESLQSNNKVINLDTGCVYSNYPGYGRLAALELYTKCLYFA